VPYGNYDSGGIAAVLETRLHQAQAEAMPPMDFLSCLIADELTRRGDRLLERRTKQAEFRDPQRSLDNFDFNFNKKMNRSLVFDLATGAFIARHEDVLFLGPPGTGKSHLAQASAPVRCSLLTDPLTTGASCWEIAPPSAPCSTACSITDTYSNAVREAGVRKSTSLSSKPRGKTT